MAVAVAPDAVGSAQMNSLVRGPFVLTPNVPTVAAPGDQFEVSVTIANGVEGSGANARGPACAPSPPSTWRSCKAPAQPVLIPRGPRSERDLHRAGAREARLRQPRLPRRSAGPGAPSCAPRLSVRPAVPFMTSVRSGNFTGSSAEVKVERAIHPDFRKLDATVSALPLGLARGLDTYLKNYPNGCSEQITQRRLLPADAGRRSGLRAQPQARSTRSSSTPSPCCAAGKTTRAASATGRRKNERHRLRLRLCDALPHRGEGRRLRAAGRACSKAGCSICRRWSRSIPRSLREARIQAYAIYLLTREGVVTTNYILNLRDYLDTHHAKQWQSDLTGVYLAGAYALLKKNDEAQKLIKVLQARRARRAANGGISTPRSARIRSTSPSSRGISRTR